MRICRRPEFLELEKGTVFAEILGLWNVGPLRVKGMTAGTDFDTKVFNEVEADSTAQMIERFQEMAETGASYPVNLDPGLDGQHGPEGAMFLIYEDADVKKIVTLLLSGLNK
jgi:hypothetical protein